jgi:hypothetical protein
MISGPSPRLQRTCSALPANVSGANCGILLRFKMSRSSRQLLGEAMKSTLRGSIADRSALSRKPLDAGPDELTGALRESLSRSMG